MISKFAIGYGHRSAHDKSESETHDSCRSFEHYQNSVTLKGEVLRKVGEGVVPSLCTQACLDTSDFVCAAALIQLPSTCFVTGYRLRDDYYSKHYYRVCASGPSCFVEKRGVTAGFTDSFAIPWYFANSPDIQPIFCMAHCEQMVSCVGFDLKTESSAMHLPGSRTVHGLFVRHVHPSLLDGAVAILQPTSSGRKQCSGLMTDT
ncbi:hypothetical protein LSAT2_002581 [Lamellibrachia satsuma]|nr:hypothetical protein LSAT2_002581 [Lamellibrachia satsuma]